MKDDAAAWPRPEGNTSLPPTDPLQGFPGLLDCVHCGLCLQACPTYQITGIESDSPRGRITLMRAQAEERATAEAVAPWVDRCVMCRACEPVCPSQVQYHQLVERQRAGAAVNRRPSFLERYAGSARLQKWLGFLARVSRRMGLLYLVERLGPGALRSLAASVPARPQLWRPAPGRIFPARGLQRGRVALHLGCTYPELLGGTLREVVAVLTHEGFEVIVPTQPPCCGALHAHAGATAQGASLAAGTLRALVHADAWIVPSAGCAAHLLGVDPSATVSEPMRFLRRQGIRGPMHSCAQSVTHAPPCHLLNVLGGVNETNQLLADVPGVKVLPLAEASLCCGAGGASFSRQPEVASALGARKAENVIASGAAWVLAGNPGCLLQIEAALRRRGSEISVAHPVRLIREALGATLPD